MRYYKIEVDETIWKYLKSKAEPFEDTPNAALHRLLFGEYNQPDESLPVFPGGTPKGLEQILEVLYEIKRFGRSRSEATNNVASRRHTAPQTVIGKYCRELNKKAYQIDRLLNEPDLAEFRRLLENKYRNHTDIIDSFFQTLHNATDNERDHA